MVRPGRSPRNAEVFKLSKVTPKGLWARQTAVLGAAGGPQQGGDAVSHALIGKAFSQVQCKRRGLEIASDLPVAHREYVQRGVATMLAQA